MISIDIEKCTGCGLCISDCLKNDIKIEENKACPLNLLCINCGHCIAICPTNAVKMDNYDMSEVESYNHKEFHIDPINFLNSVKFRRSIRRFTNKAIESEKIEKIIEAGRYSPTGGNRQHLSYIVVQKDIHELAKITIDVLYDYACNYEQNTSSTLNRYAPIWKDMHKKLMNGDDKLFYNAPALIIIMSDNNLSLSPIVDEHIDGGLAASNIEMMANLLNLGVCYNGFFTFASQDSSIRNYLGIPDNKKVLTSLLIGYTENKYQRTAPRKKPSIKWM